VANAYSATSYLNYDALGRVAQSSQTTAGQAYSFSYGYDLMGSLTSETYPSGRVITTQYDAAERVSSVAGALTSLQKNYLSSITYAPHGAMAAMQMGNNVWRVYSYNSRLQVQRIEDAVNNDPSQVLLDQQFEWGTNNNNGNLSTVTAKHGSGSQQMLTLQDHYWYDGVNRLSNAFGTDVSNNLLWAENFSYDRYGNVWTPSTAGLSVSGIMPQSNVFTNANRFQMGSYDAAGNQTFVGTYTLDYDAENRQIKANDTGTLSNGSTLYQYDGNGQRVQKARDTGTTIYVYDAFGKLTSEYTNFPTNALPCATCYLSKDHLGNTRLVTDAGATVIARHDFRPFGEEIRAGDGGRGSEWGGYDAVKQKFTGQEHDEETQFDFFQARYLSAAQQRFMSPDPGNAGADPSDPQSWNGYSYVGNNPLARVDPTGLSWLGDLWNGVSGFFGGSGCGATFCVTGTGVSDIDGSYAASGWGLGGGYILPPPQPPPPPPAYRFTITTTARPPKSGNPPLAACDSAILNAINARFKTNFTDTNVTRRFQFSTGAPAGQGTLNLNIAVPVAMQPTKVAVGRYPVNPATYILGAGATLHIPKGPGGADSPLTVPFSSSEFTAHLDSALPYNPIGFLSHLLQDMSSLGGYKPCP